MHGVEAYSLLLSLSLSFSLSDPSLCPMKFNALLADGKSVKIIRLRIYYAHHRIFSIIKRIAFHRPSRRNGDRWWTRLMVDELKMKCLPRDSRAAGKQQNAFSLGERNLTRNVNCTAHKRGHRCITQGLGIGRLRERIYFHGLRRIPLVQCKCWAPCSEAGVHFAFKRSDKSNQSSVSLVRLNPP